MRGSDSLLWIRPSVAALVRVCTSGSTRGTAIAIDWVTGRSSPKIVGHLRTSNHPTVLRGLNVQSGLHKFGKEGVSTDPAGRYGVEVEVP